MKRTIFLIAILFTAPAFSQECEAPPPEVPEPTGDVTFIYDGEFFIGSLPAVGSNNWVDRNSIEHHAIVVDVDEDNGEYEIAIFNIYLINDGGERGFINPGTVWVYARDPIEETYSSDGELLEFDDDPDLGVDIIGRLENGVVTPLPHCSDHFECDSDISVQ